MEGSKFIALTKNLVRMSGGGDITCTGFVVGVTHQSWVDKELVVYAKPL